MILVDNQGPDGAFLLGPLQAAGLPAVESRLNSADIAFPGRGQKGTSVMVGIEFKRLDQGSTDLIQSLRSGRLAGLQLPKMLGPEGEYDYAWLLVEGAWSHDDKGQLAAGKRHKPLRGKMSASELEKQVLTLELCGGLHVRYAPSRRDSVRFIGALYHWWTDRAQDQHTSHLALHSTPALSLVSEFRQAVCKWPGIGLRTSAAVEKAFSGSLRRAANAGVAQWAGIQIPGDGGKTRKLGEKTAARVVTFLEGK